MIQPKEIGESNDRSSFIRFIIRNDGNRKLLCFAVVGGIVQLLIFKSLYPFADFFSDSYSYIYAAYADLDISIWPIGYSKFLRLIHYVTTSDTVVVAFQYFFLEATCLYLYFTTLYFLKPGRSTRLILFGFLFFNPLFLYISNYINSDPLFAALSIWWFAELIWISYRPGVYQVFTHAILLFLCFSVRNNAYYYPIISILAFTLSKQKIFYKVIGLGLPVCLIVIFIVKTQKAAEKLTGHKQFSLFTGWQLANNALYMYKHIQVDSNRLPTNDCRELDRLSRKFFGQVTADFDYFLGEWEANFFIQYSRSPLKQYMYLNFRPKGEYETVVNWARASVVFEQYGKWLIVRNPAAYAKYFMLLNSRHFFLPSLEKLEIYNRGEDKVEPIAKRWFNYRTVSVSSVSRGVQGHILAVFPYLFFFLNVLTAGLVVWLGIRRKSAMITAQGNYKVLLLIVSFLVANFCFCVSVTIVVMRYQFVPMILTLGFGLLAMENLEKGIAGEKNPDMRGAEVIA